MKNTIAQIATYLLIILVLIASPKIAAIIYVLWYQATLAH